MIFLFFQSLYKSIKRHFRVALIKSKYACKIESTVDIRFDSIEDIAMGRDVYIGAFTVIHVQNKPGKKNSQLIIGEGTSIGEFNNIRASGGAIIIGKKCLISQHISIIAANHEYEPGIPVIDQDWSEKKTGVFIGDDVWIGCNTVILPGVRIGSGSVIGAGSVITKDIPENSVAFGVPCNVRSERK